MELPDQSWNATKTIAMSSKVDLTKPYNVGDLAGKSILITGGASGFGAAFAKHWAAYGAHVVIGDVNDALGKAVVSEMRSLPDSSGHHHYQHCDVTSWEDQVALFKTAAAVSPTGGIDVVVACAGIAELDSAVTGRGFENPGDLDAERPPRPPLAVLDVNLTGTMYSVHLALFWLPKNGNRKDGKPRDRLIVLLSSVAGISPLPGQPEYTASKHALVGLFRSLRGTVWRHGIRCNLIAPYFVNTPLLPTAALFFLAGGSMAELEDVVDATTRLVADESISGRGLLVGPRAKAQRLADGGLDLVDSKDYKEHQRAHRTQERTQAVWDFCADDYEAVEVFVHRYIGVLNLLFQMKGLAGLLKDLLSIFIPKKK